MPAHARITPGRRAAAAGVAGAVLLALTAALAPGSGALAQRTVLPVVETESFPVGSGDVADDSAIWRDPVDPARSVVVADSKSATRGGIGVFDLSGRLLQFLQAGRIGNVDLREDVPLGGSGVVLVGANNRTTGALEFWTLDPVTRTLTPVTARLLPTMPRNYGFCLYRSPVTATLYAFVTQDGGPLLQQYALSDAGGRVDATLVRTLTVGATSSSQSEGCVADDERGLLYVGEEDVAIWRYGAEPGDGTARVAVDRAGAGRLVKDIEGLALTYGPGGTGLLLASSQGDSTVAVYRREGDNAFVTSFAVAANGSVDGVTATDGVAAHAGDFGAAFPGGLVVVHDATNTGGTTSNLKLLSLHEVTRTDVPITLTLPAVADTYLNTSSRTTAYGSATKLRVSPAQYTALLRFDLSSVPAGATVLSAVLEPYSPSAVASCRYEVHPFPEPWAERTVTAATAAAVPADVLGTSQPLLSGRWMPVPLPAAAVPAGGTVSFAVRGQPGCTTGYLSSRETSRPPRLVVTYGPAVSAAVTVTGGDATAVR